MRNYEDLKTEVLAAGGIKWISNGKLRDIHGSIRLGGKLCQKIARELEAAGLRLDPESLVPDCTKSTLVWVAGTPGGLVGEATVGDPGNNERLRSVVDDLPGRQFRPVMVLVAGTSANEFRRRRAA